MPLLSTYFVFLCFLPVKSLKISEIPSSGAPPPHKNNLSGVYDPEEFRIITFGGANLDSNILSSTLDSFNLLNNTWDKSIPTSYLTPPPLESSRLYLRSDRKLLLFFGETTSGVNSEVYTFDLNTYSWRLETLTGDPLPGRSRFGFTSFTYLSIKYLALFGGLTHIGMSNDLFM